MSTQHTSGPWEIDGEYVQQSGHPDVGICDVLNMDRGGDKQWFRGPITEANTLLIAAAPDMYEALRMAEAALNHIRCTNRTVPWDDTGPAVEAARAALAKAEGKS